MFLLLGGGSEETAAGGGEGFGFAVGLNLNVDGFEEVEGSFLDDFLTGKVFLAFEGGLLLEAFVLEEKIL